MKTMMHIFTGCWIFSRIVSAQASHTLDDDFLSRLRTEASHAHPAAVAAKQRAAATEAANAAAQAYAYAGEVHDKAQQTAKTIEAAWISSKAPLTDMLDASRTLFAIHLEERRFIAMEQAALEELHTLVPPR